MTTTKPRKGREENKDDYNVIFELSHCTARDPSTVVRYIPYANILEAGDGYTFNLENLSKTGLRCWVSMGGVDISAQAVIIDGDDARIYIEDVTGDLWIAVASVEESRPAAVAHNVTLDLSYCTASNTSSITGSTYSNTLTPAVGYKFANSGPSLGGFDIGGSVPSDPNLQKQTLYCIVAMGEENVTTQSFDIETGEILIEDVTGDIVVRVTRTKPE